MMRGKHRQTGFTLLELLVAMAVFVVMAAMAYAGLHGVLETRRAVQQRSEVLAQWQNFTVTLNEDLQQALPRGVRDQLGGEQPAFAGGNDQRLLSLTRSVADWSHSSLHGKRQRVEYHREADGIYRLVWPVLDRTQQSQARRRKVLNVDQLALRFYGVSWGALWPTVGGGLPKAVEVSLNLPGIGTVRRMFALRP